MKRGCGGASLAPLIGAMLGPFVVTALVFGPMSLLYPAFLHDGQSGMLLLLTLPGGIVVGAFVGIVYLVFRGKRRQ